MPSELDRIDLKILRLLQANGRLTNAELAQSVAVSPATCHRRTQRLFEDSYISHVRAAVAPQKVDRGALVAHFAHREHGFHSMVSSHFI